MDMLTDAVVQPSYDTGLRWSQGGRKGFMLITLTKTKHHTEYW